MLTARLPDDVWAVRPAMTRTAIRATKSHSARRSQRQPEATLQHASSGLIILEIREVPARGKLGRGSSTGHRLARDEEEPLELPQVKVARHW